MISQSVIANSDTVLLTAPALTTLGTACLMLCNTNAASETVSVHIVKSTDTIIATTNMILCEVTIQGKDTLIINMEKFVLEEGDRISAIGTVGNYVTATVSYLAL